MTEVLRGKRALVTGASGGLGRAIANELTNHGCELVLVGRSWQKLADVCEETGGRRIWCDFEDQYFFIEMLQEHHVGQIDILINCAGIFPISSIDKATSKDFDRCFAVNVRAPFLLMQHFAPLMVGRGWGRIVNIGSSSAYAGFPNTSIYCASKHALLGLSRALREELDEYRVRVYCVSPGSIRTEMGKRVPTEQRWETFLYPEEVAKYVAFLIGFDGPAISEEVRINRLGPNFFRADELEPRKLPKTVEDMA
jgi:NAD(P)-dependent dehydrogenase (short-subunit alcohol dehydrogenase family)